MNKFLESKKSILNLAVLLKDDKIPDKKVIGDVYLEIKGRREQPIRHSTGYFLFINLPAGKYEFAAGGTNYTPENFEIDTKDIKKQEPFYEHSLKRKKNDPFTGSSKSAKSVIKKKKLSGGI